MSALTTAAQRAAKAGGARQGNLRGMLDLISAMAQPLTISSPSPSTPSPSPPLSGVKKDDDGPASHGSATAQGGGGGGAEGGSRKAKKKKKKHK